MHGPLNVKFLLQLSICVIHSSVILFLNCIIFYAELANYLLNIAV